MNSYTNSGTSISSSSSASDALFELDQNYNDDDDDELDRRLAVVVANSDAHENASLACKVPGAWPAEFAAEDDLFDMNHVEDDDDREEEADAGEGDPETPVFAALNDDDDDLNRLLALSVATTIVMFLCLLLSLFSSLFFVVIFHVVFEVSLLVEVRLRGSLSARCFLVFPSTTKLQSSNVIMSRV
jgi:hypothetical protein